MEFAPGTLSPAGNSAPRLHTPFIQVPQSLLAVTHGEFKIYCVLLTHINIRKNGNRCWPGLATVAREAGLGSTDQARRYIRKLEERGELRTERRVDNSNIYYLRRIVANGSVIDAGPDIPSLSSAQLMQPSLESGDAAGNERAPVAPVSGRQVPGTDGTETEPADAQICGDTIAFMQAPAGRSASGWGHKCKPNQIEEPDLNNQTEEQQQPCASDAAGQRNGCKDVDRQDMLARLVTVGMLETEARKLLSSCDHELVERALAEAAGRSDIQNLPGWIIRVAHYRQRDIRYKALYSGSAGRRSGKYIPNAPYYPPPDRQAMPASGEPDRVETAGAGIEPVETGRQEPLELPGIAGDERQEVSNSTAFAGQAAPTPGALPAGGIYNDDILKRRALPVLIRWEKPQINLPPLPADIYALGEQALCRLGQAILQSQLRLQLLDDFDRRVLDWGRQHVFSVAA